MRDSPGVARGGMLLALLLAAAVPIGAAEVRVGPGVPVNPGVFGVNDLHADADLLETKPAYRALLRALGARQVRYIGGSPSSFWEWRSGHYVPRDEITPIWPAEHHNWMLDNHWADTNALPAGTLGPLAFHEFAEAIRARVQWLTNMTTRAADQPALFELLATEGVPVRFVEMDNETYFWGAEFGEEERGEAYARRVDALSPVVRRLFPDARIGIVAAEDGLFTDDHEDVEPPMAAWNGHITKPEHRPHYDAFILHHYAMGKGRLDAFTEEEARRKAFLALPQVTVERAAREIASRFGAIPMWITEYNVIAYYGPAGGTSPSDLWIQATRDTPWNALYQAGFWLTGLARPDAVEILNHHSVSNTDLGWGLGQPVSEDETEITITGQLFAHLSWLAAGHDTMHPLVIEDNPPLGVTVEGEADVRALHGAALRGEGRVTYLLMNRGGAELPSRLERPSGPARIEEVTYAATASCPALGRVRLDGDSPVWEQGPCAPRRESRRLEGQDAVALDLPPYSLTVLTVQARLHRVIPTARP